MLGNAVLCSTTLSLILSLYILVTESQASPVQTVVGLDANFSFLLNEDPGLSIVRIKDKNGVLVVSARGNGSMITNPVYSDRVNFAGNTNQKLISFILRNVTLVDAGMYIAAIGVFPSPDRTIGSQMLIVKASPSKPQIVELNGPAVNSSDYHLNCSAHSNSEPPNHNLIMLSEWRKNSLTITPTGRYIANQTELTITGLNYIQDNRARLICVAFEDQRAKSEYSGEFIIDVKYGPVNIQVSPLSGVITERENGQIIVNCTADCNPPCSFQWRKELVPTPLANSQTLIINNVSKDDTGHYLCYISNNITGISQIAQLTIMIIYGPSGAQIMFSPSELPLKAEENTKVNINCSADCYPDCNFTWSGPRGFFQMGSQLSQNIERDKDGNYTCIATNQVNLGKTATASATVIALYAPEISIKIIPPIAEINSEVHIECLAHGEPPDYKFYYWTHKIGNMELRHVIGFQGNQSVSVASFPSITIADMGTYICSVENGIAGPDGGIVQSMEAQLDVVGVPVAFIRDTVFIGEANKSSSIQVPFLSNPLITTLKFFKTWNNAPIANDTDTQVYFTEANISTVFHNTNVVLQGMAAVLHFRSLKESDFGQYTLVLYNNKGTATLSIHLQALAPPSPVEQFNFYKLVGQYMEFFFIPGFNGGHQQTFTIQFKPTGSLDESWKNTSINGLSETDERYRLPNGTFLVPVEKPQPGRYVFRMFFVNKKNIRMYSQEVSVYIQEEPHTNADNRPSIAGIAGGIGGGVVAILITGVVIFLWRRHSHANKAASGTAFIPTAVDYEALQTTRNEGSLYQELSDIKSCADTKNSFRRNGTNTTENQPAYITTKETSCSTQDQGYVKKGENKIYENTRVQT